MYILPVILTLTDYFPKNINRLNFLMDYVLCETINEFLYEGWNFNSGNYLFTTDKK